MTAHFIRHIIVPDGVLYKELIQFNLQTNETIFSKANPPWRRPYLESRFRFTISNLIVSVSLTCKNLRRDFDQLDFHIIATFLQFCTEGAELDSLFMSEHLTQSHLTQLLHCDDK